MAEATGTQAIERAAQLLVRVVESAQPPSVSELAARAGLPKSTTSRLVGALERQGLVQRLGERGRLRPGPVLLSFASRDGSPTLVELAAPSLRRLAEASGETINLAVPGPDGVEHLAQEDTAHFVGVTDWVGRRVPHHIAANGKVFLAFGAATLPPGALPALTPYTVRRRTVLERQLADARDRGWAQAVGEYEDGLNGVAAPVFDRHGDCVAALSVSGPSYRVPPERLPSLGRLCIDAAEEIAAALQTQGGSLAR
jgi:DNA-binding IclR family transcriptional regulator